MNKTKTKKNIKVRDLKPSKDAKGGGGVHALGATPHGSTPHGSTPHGVTAHGSQGRN